MKIHQFHHSVSPYDAVTNHMRLIQTALAAEGVSGEIYASQNPAQVPGIKKPEATTLSPDDIVLIHHSQGNPELAQWLSLPCRKALVYHNITPGDWLKHDGYLRELAQVGREQLLELRSSCEVAFTVSHFNAEELKALAFPQVEVIPLIDLGQTTPISRTSTPSEISLLFVGRLMPHKEQKKLIEVLSFLHLMGEKSASLQLVGGGDPLYRRYLQSLSQVLGVTDRVHFTGKVSEAELSEIYSKATYFVCLSHHEGFCIPLVEAMRHGLPVISTTVTALAETLGGAGVHLKSDDPKTIAALVKALHQETGAAAQLQHSGFSRIKELERFQNQKQLAFNLLQSLR